MSDDATPAISPSSDPDWPGVGGPVSDYPDVESRLEVAFRDLCENAMHAAQNHFESAKTWRARHHLLGGTAAVLGTASGSAVLASEDLRVVGGVLALVAAALTALLTRWDAESESVRATALANNYLEVQHACQTTLKVDLHYMSVRSARLRLDDLQHSYHDINARAPVPGGRARRRGKRNVEKGFQTPATEAERSG